MPEHGAYIREKLRGAKATLEDEDSGRSLPVRLRDAYIYNLSHLYSNWFPDVEAQEDFRAIQKALNRYGEAPEDQGAVPTTTWLRDEVEAQAIAKKVMKLADWYLA